MEETSWEAEFTHRCSPEKGNNERDEMGSSRFNFSVPFFCMYC